MSVVLVIAVGLFFLRDNIAKFINNAATQIAGEESDDGLNEYGFYFDKIYWNEEIDTGWVFREDGSIDLTDENGNVLGSMPAGTLSYSNGVAINNIGGSDVVFEPGGKSWDMDGLEMKLKE